MFVLSFTYNNVVSVQRGFLFLLVLGMGCVVLLWHSLCLPYNYSAVFIFWMLYFQRIPLSDNLDQLSVLLDLLIF